MTSVDGFGTEARTGPITSTSTPREPRVLSDWTKDWYGQYHAIDPAVKENDGSAFTMCSKIITHPGTITTQPDALVKHVCIICLQRVGE